MTLYEKKRDVVALVKYELMAVKECRRSMDVRDDGGDDIHI